MKPSAPEATARVIDAAGASDAARGQRVATKCFLCARSRSRSQNAMLTQLSQQRAANRSAAKAVVDLAEARSGAKTRRVPAANNVPIAISLIGIAVQILLKRLFTTK